MTLPRDWMTESGAIYRLPNESPITLHSLSHMHTHTYTHKHGTPMLFISGLIRKQMRHAGIYGKDVHKNCSLRVGSLNPLREQHIKN